MLNRIIDICRRISYFVGLIILLTRYMNRYMNARKIVPLTPKHIEEGTNGHLFPDDIFDCVPVNEDIWISI